jgi:FAD/FMN-containing dehydrogenase
MGGQQFAEGAVLLDVRPMRRIIELDAERGVVEAEAGIQWPDPIEGLIAMQGGQAATWGIIQKQTGADRLTLGGASAPTFTAAGSRSSRSLATSNHSH